MMEISRIRTTARAEPAVERHDAHQQDGLRGRRIGRHLGAAFRQDQPVARRLHQRVAGQQQEDVDGEQQRADTLAGPDVREQREQPLERTLGSARRAS